MIDGQVSFFFLFKYSMFESISLLLNFIKLYRVVACLRCFHSKLLVAELSSIHVLIAGTFSFVMLRVNMGYITLAICNYLQMQVTALPIRQILP